MPETRGRLRVAARLANAFILDLMKHGGEGRHVFDFLIRMAISETNLNHLQRDPALSRRYASLANDPPDDLRRPVSINALAHSLRTPFETTRRRIRRMCDQGLCQIVPGGVIVPQAATSTATHHAALMFQWKTLRRLYMRLRDIGMLEDLGQVAPPCDLRDPPVRLVERHVSEYMLRYTEARIMRLGDPMRALILMELINANVEHLDEPDAGFEPPAPDGVPPDAWRRPASARTLSLRLACPYETVRRHLAGLEGAGVVHRIDRGYIVPSRVLTAAHIERFIDDNYVQLTRLFTALAEPGVPAAWSAERGRDASSALG
jgi:DNA-binding transcriptional ArsR family regulator